MSERTEREAIARIIQEARDRPDIMAIHIADIVLREHIEPLRAALRLDQQVEDINVAIQRTRAENAEAALGRMEFERDQAKVARDELSARYGDVSEKLGEAHCRASALEAQLAECETALEPFSQAEFGDTRRAAALLAKLTPMNDRTVSQERPMSESTDSSNAELIWRLRNFGFTCPCGREYGAKCCTEAADALAAADAEIERLRGCLKRDPGVEP